jgi:hypothetical protein
MATRTESIASIYAAMSGKRVSDISKSDLDHWVNLDASISLEAINSSMVAMSGAVIYPTGTEALVKSVFEAVFGYMPNDQAAGFKYWVNEIDSGSVSKDTLSIALLKGAAAADEAKAIAKVAAAVTNFDAGQTFLLTTTQDNIMGTAQNDTINAFIVNNADTAQSGDMISGGAGTDRLNADMATSSLFATTLHTTSVEEFAVRAEADNTSDNSQNNIDAGTVAVNIDAERMVGTNRYESNNSRADVVIEDVRIESDQITKDVTIAMVQTDPGNVDMGVYFDQHSLINAPAVAAGAGIDLKVMDIFSAADRGNFLEKNPYNKVIFNLDGVEYVVEIAEQYIRGTYDQLLTGLTLAINATPGLETVTAAITGSFTGSDSRTNTTISGGQTITLTTSDARIFTTGGWAASGVMPADSSFVALQGLHVGTASTYLVTSTILLDDVGRGSQGGDLIVGGLSTGDTSTSKGVEQFDITVERSSQLQEIQSTNNTLKEVYIVNGVTKGNLTVVGQVTGTTGNTANLPASDADTAGFTDVRVVDASAMVGSVNINAAITDASVAKYMNLKDTATSASADNITFNYALGSGNDTLTLDISESNLAAAGNTSREDFKLTVSGGAGNDTITTTIETANAAVANNAANFWYSNSKDNANMSVDGGAGNDTIKTIGAGDMTITAGTGDDTVYTNNDALTVAASDVPEVQTITFADSSTNGTSDIDTMTPVVFSTVNAAGTTVTATFTPVQGANAAANAAAAALALTGIAGTSIISTAVVSGNNVVITYDAATGDVAPITITGGEADTQASVATAITTAGVNDTAAVAAVAEVSNITITQAANSLTGSTLIFDGTTITLADTDGSGAVTLDEATEQIAGASYTNFNVTAYDYNAGTLTLTSKAGGTLVDLADGSWTGTDAANLTFTNVVGTQGAAAVALVNGADKVETFTFTAADETGTLTLMVDSDGNGVKEAFKVALSDNDSAFAVAEKAKLVLDASTNLTAVHVAGTDLVTVTWADGKGVGVASSATDGGFQTALATAATETTKGDVVSASTAATWAVNATNADITDLNSAPLLAKGLLYNASLTVTLSDAMYTAAIANGAAVSKINGFESTVTIGNTNYGANQQEVNQAIKAAINSDAVLSKLLVANDGPANTLVITSLIDGRFDASDLAISIAAPTSLTTAETNTLNTAYQTMMHDSTLVKTSAELITIMGTTATALDTAVNEKFAQTAGADMAGSNSVSESDNSINLGSGNDVLVLGTDANSNDTVVFTGSDIGSNVIVNFVNVAGNAGIDKLDFSSYLTNQTDASANTNAYSVQTVARTGDNTGVGASTATANEVITINDFAQTSATVGTWSGMTAANLLAAIQNETGTAVTYGNIVNASLDVANTANLVGTTQHSMVMVENDLNQGEYKVFDVTSSTATTEFTAATLIGTVDFGASIDASVVGTLV